MLKKLALKAVKKAILNATTAKKKKIKIKLSPKRAARIARRKMRIKLRSRKLK